MLGCVLFVLVCACVCVRVFVLMCSWMLPVMYCVVLCGLSVVFAFCFACGRVLCNNCVYVFDSFVMYCVMVRGLCLCVLSLCVRVFKLCALFVFYFVVLCVVFCVFAVFVCVAQCICVHCVCPVVRCCMVCL